MDEENTEKPTTDDTGEGDQPKTPKAIVDANTAAERLEKATAAQKEENDRADEG